MKKNKYVIRWKTVEFQNVEAESPEAIQDDNYEVVGESITGLLDADIMDASGNVVICSKIK